LAGARVDEETQAEHPKKNGKLLTLLLSSGGDVSVKLITLALVVVTGGGNLFQTQSLGTEMKAELERAFRQLRELHDDFVVNRQTNDNELARAIRETHEIHQGVTNAQRDIVTRQEKVINQQEHLTQELNELETKLQKFTKSGTW
jgi:hypothetical protein